jgi:hypothetical protein
VAYNFMRRAHWWAGLFVLAISALVLGLGYAGVAAWQGRSRQGVVRNMAVNWGYTPSLEIALVGRCWDVFSHCGHFLYYETDFTRDDLARGIDGLAWMVANEMEIDGYEIFTALNLGTEAELRVGGIDALGDRSNLPAFDGYRWRLVDKAGRTWTISYFPVAAARLPVTLNGRTLQMNIVSILYQTR